MVEFNTVRRFIAAFPITLIRVSTEVELARNRLAPPQYIAFASSILGKFHKFLLVHLICNESESQREITTRT